MRAKLQRLGSCRNCHFHFKTHNQISFCRERHNRQIIQQRANKTTMISIRSAMSRNVIGRRSAPNAGAAFLQANIPFPTKSDDESRTNDPSPSVRHFASPAYRRYQAKQKQEAENVRASKPSIGARQDGIQVPTKMVARDMGMSFSEMENEPLQIIAEMGNHAARYEVLQRHIMAVDDVEYDVAGVRMQEIEARCKEGLFLYALPYRIGIAVSVFAGLGAIPMVFDFNVASIFNEACVTMEVPPPDELDTRLGKSFIGRMF